MTQDEINDAEWRNPSNWHGGALGVYYSKRDTRPHVPKRHPALGFTVNFARPLGVGLLVGILALPLLLYVFRHNGLAR